MAPPRKKIYPEHIKGRCEKCSECREKKRNYEKRYRAKKRREAGIPERTAMPPKITHPDHKLGDRKCACPVCTAKRKERLLRDSERRRMRKAPIVKKPPSDKALEKARKAIAITLTPTPVEDCGEPLEPRGWCTQKLPCSVHPDESEMP